MPANILNLPQFIIKKVAESDHDYRIEAEVAEHPDCCLTCNAAEIVGFGRRDELLMDTPMHGKRVGIVVDRRRYRCSGCGKTFYEIIPGKDSKRHATQRLVTYVERQALNRTFAQISEEIGIDEKTVRNIFHDYVERQEKITKFVTPRYMGIDEIHIIQKPRCIVTNIEEQTLVDMLHNRSKPNITRYFHDLKDKHSVEFVAMDMWRPYKEAVNGCLPKASIVIDKFHVVRMANDALEKARKSVRAGLTPSQRRRLMHDRHILLRRGRDMTMTEKIAFDSWTLNFPAIGEAYALKEAFYEIWEKAKNRHEAEVFYSRWESCLSAEMTEHFKPLLTAISNWRNEIFAYFEYPITNAYTESLNNLIRFINRAGRGYSFEALRAKILFTYGFHKTKTQRPPFQRNSDSWGMGRGLPCREAEETNYGASISTLARHFQEQASDT